MRRLCGVLFLEAVSLVLRAQTATETALLNFSEFPGGSSPYGTLAMDASGNFYGATNNGGGVSQSGAVFEYSADGNYSVLYTFQGGPTDGSGPYAGVALDASGNLYGTTEGGGSAGLGTVYKISTTGQETVLHSFTGGTDGSNPYSGLTIDSAGNLYGTTYYGGPSNAGVVWKITPSGQESVLYAFTGGTDGANPYAGVTLAPSGDVYGTTVMGGLNNEGAVYKCGPSGEETALFSFGPPVDTGDEPQAGVILDSQGNLYGTAASVVYKLSPSGQYTKLATLTEGKYGGYLSPGMLAMDSAGNLYGTTNKPSEGNYSAYPYGALYKVTPKGEVTVLYKFPGVPRQVVLGGPTTNSNVVLSAAGNMYGLTVYGGVSGALYEVNTAGQASILHNFTGAPSGSDPNPVLITSKGEIYGTTFYGGTNNYGMVYRLVGGKQTALYNFRGYKDGANPAVAPLAMDSAKNLYGTAVGGGSTANAGTVFKISPSGDETTLHSFTGGSDGANPDSGVILGPDGNLYGTTSAGGSGSLTGTQEGVVFKMTTSGEETVLYSFTGLDDGGQPPPESWLAVDAEGNLYGTTYSGGTSNGGVVYKLTPAGEETVLFTFTGGADGAYPTTGVVLDAAGNLYGTNSFGGSLGGGVLFKLSPAGEFTVLHNFGGGSAGDEAVGVVLDSAGNLFGATGFGGGPGCFENSGCGLAFRVDPAGNYSVIYTFTGGADGGGGVLSLSPQGELYGVSGAGTEGGGMLYKLKF